MIKNKLKPVATRLLKWIAIIFGILLLLIYFANWGIKSYMFGFHRINRLSVSSIVIYKSGIESLENKLDSVTLDKKHINSFVFKWNNLSYPIGPCKFMSSYNIVVKMDDGSMRKFRTTHSVIKENTGCGFIFFNDENYFEKIWNKK